MTCRDNCIHYNVCYKKPDHFDDLDVNGGCSDFEDNDLKDVYNYKKDIHGEWLPINDDSYYCSVCNRGSLRYDFCPHCGADMRGIT